MYWAERSKKTINDKSGSLFGIMQGSTYKKQRYESAKILIDLDGTNQKKKLGANSILGVSIACCKLAAKEKKVPIYKHVS